MQCSSADWQTGSFSKPQFLLFFLLLLYFVSNTVCRKKLDFLGFTMVRNPKQRILSTLSCLNLSLAVLSVLHSLRLFLLLPLDVFTFIPDSYQTYLYEFFTSTHATRISSGSGLIVAIVELLLTLEFVDNRCEYKLYTNQSINLPIKKSIDQALEKSNTTLA